MFFLSSHIHSVFFLLAKTSGRDESWLVYFWGKTLPLATEGVGLPEKKTLHLFLLVDFFEV
jgi:hypothetical protein